ncbi:MAG: hypothetical protein A3E31_02050 [Candidatus Rokubacteria bacterium RIFCSPHIGHO2_12_FULL_73_22]|nr:MAG: hypothetical protein A3E31_02050 [Candidatus Rokubacteria bacterium RIFCSPHIGHO2_12_FULL_73_22]OGL21647.1 MAG: hypothetical protein A3G44_12835 [Candidatus Rokubacteria bacterium RIFCSPLOWO2_12_FULL_73_47]
MLTAEYGQWFDGEKWPFVGYDTIRSSPVLAGGTRYGIHISNMAALGGAGWSAVGGLVARVVRPGASVELFGKEIVQTHGMKGTATRDDYSYEFFLVVRPSATGRGRLVKQWAFPREEIAGIPPDRPENFPRGFVRLSVDGFLALDEGSKIATVTITGLVRPFQEHVDLSSDLL